MKLAFTVATPDTADASMLALRGPLRESFARLSGLGYDGVELMVRDVVLLDRREIAALAAEHGLVVGAVSTGQLRKEDGLTLNNVEEAGRRLAVDRTKAVLDFAAEFGAQVNIGTLRGHLPAGATERVRALDAARRSFSELRAHGAGARLAIEPQCKWVINWLNRAMETVRWMESNELEPAILFDLYHANLEEDSVAAAMIEARDAITWVQVSDSNRRAPGQGHWSFADPIRVLRALRYEGFVSVECLAADDAPERAMASLRTLVG